jgi:hypothetical protein
MRNETVALKSLARLARPIYGPCDSARLQEKSSVYGVEKQLIGVQSQENPLAAF